MIINIIKRVISFILSPFHFIVVKIPAEYRGKLATNVFPGFHSLKKGIIYESLQIKPIDEFSAVYPIVKDHTMVPYDVLASLYDQVKYLELNGIEGDFVECGVWKGGAVGVMAAASQKYASHIRNIHLFDAFDDITQPDPLKDGDRALRDIAHFSGADPALMKGELRPVRGIYNSFGGHGTIDECRSLLIGKINCSPQNIFFYKG